MFQGVYTAVVTPFQKGKIDYKAYSKILEKQRLSGVRGIVPCGTTGESPTLSHAEHKEFLQETIRETKGALQVIAGTGSNSTEEAVELTEFACKAGVDGILSVNPYYNKPTQEGLFLHFSMVAKASSRPVMLYNIPGRTGVNLLPETVKRLAELPNIQGIKEATGDLGQMAKVLQLVPNIDLLSGDDNLTLPVLSIGGKGVVSVVSNAFPKTCHQMVDAYVSGKTEESKKLFYMLLPVFQLAFLETNPIPIKAAMHWLGYCENELRLPMTSLSQSSQAEEFKKLVLDLRSKGYE